MGDGGLTMEVSLCSVGLTVFDKLFGSVYAYLLVGGGEADCSGLHWRGYREGLISIN